MYKLLTNFLQTFYKLVVNFSQTSYELLTNFLYNLYNLLMNLQTSHNHYWGCGQLLWVKINLKAIFLCMMYPYIKKRSQLDIDQKVFNATQSLKHNLITISQRLYSNPWTQDQLLTNWPTALLRWHLNSMLTNKYGKIQC